MHMGPLKAPTLSQMHAKSRKLFNLYEEQGDKGYEEAEDTGDVDEERSPPDEPGVCQTPVTTLFSYSRSETGLQSCATKTLMGVNAGI